MTCSSCDGDCRTRDACQLAEPCLVCGGAGVLFVSGWDDLVPCPGCNRPPPIPTPTPIPKQYHPDYGVRGPYRRGPGRFRRALRALFPFLHR